MPFFWFKKKKPPPFSLNKHFYLSILAPSEILPPLLQVANRHGNNGAVIGLGAPLHLGADRDLLNSPISIGAYAFTTLEKTTVVRVDVFRTEDVEFKVPSDPPSQQIAGLTGERLHRAQNARYLINSALMGYDREVYPSVRFFLDLVRRLASLCEAVVADPLAETYRLPEEWTYSIRLDPRLDFREIGAIKVVTLSDGLWVSTRGLCKFNLLEYEIYSVPPDLAETAMKMLIAAGQQTLIGIPIREGESAFAPDAPLVAHMGTRQRHEWGDRPVLEFRPRHGKSIRDSLLAWQRLGN